MRQPFDRFRIDVVEPIASNSPDDLYVCCASFEERAVGAVRRLSDKYQCRIAVIFLYESREYKEDRMERLQELRQALDSIVLEACYVVPCLKDEAADGIGQLRQILARHPCEKQARRVTLDITTFTKLYELEILHFLTEELQATQVRCLYTLPKAYAGGHLTEGVGRVVILPHFRGLGPANGDVVLITFLGFEPERALAVWEFYDPRKTTAIVASPPLKEGYDKRVKRDNSFLLGRPGVVEWTAQPYDPFDVRQTLESLYAEEAKACDDGKPRLALAPFGTHVQALGLFLFWRNHHDVQVAYTFPREYKDTYRQRRAGELLELRLGDELVSTD